MHFTIIRICRDDDMEQSVKDILADDFWIMPATPEYIDEGVPYITSKNIKNGIIDFTKVNYISQDAYENISKNRPILVGDILISMIGTLGETAEVKESDGSFYGQNMFLVRLDESKINKRYFLNFFKSNCVKRALEGKQNQSTQKYLKANHIEDLIIPVPALDEQKLIAKQLDKLAGIIALRNEELKYLDNLIKARFVELFGDPKLNDKGWDAGIISDYYEVKGGKRIPKGMGYADGVTAHPYLRATDMKNETILDDDIHYIDEEVYEHIKRYTVKSGDIYLTNVGVNLGMAGVIPEKYDGANLTENAVKLVPKTEKVIDGIFLAHYINSPGIQDYINERKMSVGVPKLAIFRIETMPLLLPPRDIQMQFIEFCNQVDKSKVAVQKSLDETQQLFDSLMQKYFG